MSATHETIVEELSSYILENSDIDSDELGEDTHLFDSGILDSLTARGLLAFVKERFNYVVDE